LSFLIVALHVFSNLHFLPILFFTFASKSKFYFNCKYVQFLKQSNPFHFSKSSPNSFYYCISVQILITFQSSKFSKLRFGPRARNSSKSHAGSPSPHVLFSLVQIHMAAYKRPPLYKSEGIKKKIHAPHQKRVQIFSLSCQLDQIVTNSEKIEEQFENPRTFRAEFEPNPWKWC